VGCSFRPKRSESTSYEIKRRQYNKIEVGNTLKDKIGNIYGRKEYITHENLPFEKLANLAFNDFSCSAVIGK